MKFTLLTALLFHGVQHVDAHYVFSYMFINDTLSQEWQYVAAGSEVVPPIPRNPVVITAPNYDLYSPNIRCGRDGYLNGKGTQTATVVAGTEIGMRIGAWDQGMDIFHTGPAQVYLSKSPTSDLESYMGDGDWFKIKYFGPILDPGVPLNRNWEATGHTQLNFTIPKTTPPGKYLLRIEQFYIYLSDAFNSTQFYLNCGQIEIVGEGGGKPGPLVKFPGAYDYFERALWTERDLDLKTYVPPGPTVWSG